MWNRKMLWPFNRFRNPTVPRGTIEAIYGMIVAQAREPAFYADLNVRDTVDGRFDMLILHLWLVLRRLQAVDGGNNLSQALFDHFCADMDDNLREMGGWRPDGPQAHAGVWRSLLRTLLRL